MSPDFIHGKQATSEKYRNDVCWARSCHNRIGIIIIIIIVIIILIIVA